ncbi:MAG: Lon protease [Alphaproteobacteria bacterium MarineAlpha5_Bin9]|nr:MAG: Lon protease [Alphaproteobacteria bacterium MarineAlpha5_Bin9]|tara:strand:+ start:5373 stop:5993 length:621 start_codon:yes stop_codon:yes gene_type:complete
MINLPSIIPVFPLAGAVLLPEGNLPLNIFEKRYIAMVDYALANKKLIGMIQTNAKDNNKLYNIGCLGKITSYSETDDNRYLINLRGVSKFKIINEINNDRGFRQFEVTYKRMDYKIDVNFDTDNMKALFINRVKNYLKSNDMVVEDSSLKKINYKNLLIMMAMICPFSVNEKQALLESKNINELSNKINTLFEFSSKNTNSDETIN